jgi:hypothetical protein
VRSTFALAGTLPAAITFAPQVESHGRRARGSRNLFTIFLISLLLLLAATPNPGFAQGTVTATLSGTVFDSSGAVVPGATVTAKNTATSTTRTTTSDANGLFTIPALDPGNYTVTVSMTGFKTAELANVRLNANVPANVRPVLEPGGVTETVTVEAASDVIQTTKTSVATTLSQQQITNLPLPGRGAFDLVSFMPGVTTSNGSTRGAMVNGLPAATVNITLDGMNIQDNYAKTWDGMFTRVSPRLDAVEEVTISTAANSANIAGQGGVQVKFVTRSGTNDYHGSAYYYLQRDWMNTNTWFNLNRNVDKTTGAPTPKPRVANYQPGFRLGGPVRIPHLFDGRDKLFFFVNYEWVSSPGTSTLNRTIMTPLSEQGIFKYTGGTVDLLALAARNGQTATIDPTVARLLGDVRASTKSATALTDDTDLLTQNFTWQQPTKSKVTYPTVRVDYNLTSRQKLTGSITQNHLISDPDTTNSMQPRFPGFPVRGKQDSVRYTGQGSWQWMMTNSMVNEFRFGKTGGATKFSPDLTADMFAGTGFGGQNGYAISWSAFRSLTNPYSNSANSAREGKTMVFEDNLNWQKGSHSLSMGVSYTKAQVWLYNQQKVPTVTLGMATGDPADAMFSAANFPGASSTDRTNAKNLYAVLTGRVTSIGRNARIQADGSTYQILGASNQYGTLPQWGSFINDTWRATPNLTINAGLRYDVQRPFYADNNSYSMATMEDLFGITGLGSDFEPGSVVNHLGNLFKPGVFQGSPTTYEMLKKGVNAYNTDWSNLGPSLGAAWNVGAESGFLHALLGAPGSSVLRAGASLAYQRGGMSDFTGPLGANPGVAIDATRSLTNGNLGTLPVLLSSSDLGPPAMSLTRSYPMAVPSASSSVYVFDPNLKTPSAFTYSFSWQRKVSANMALEARFIHTASYNQWTGGQQLNYLNYNELNILENGFFDEFKLAQANLQANLAAGKGETFAYTGVPGTSPLPIMLAFLNGSTAANDPKSYTGSGWTNSTMRQAMYPDNPNPYTAAGVIWPTGGNATYKANGLQAGYPANFFVANPDVSYARLVTNAPSTRYNGVQLSLNRRFSQGLLFQLNYTYGKAFMDQFYSFHKPYVETEMNYTNVYSNQGGNATGNVRHVFVGNWVYDLPFGRGRRFASGANGLLDRIIGGWSLQGVARLQSGRMLDFGNVRLVGMTAQDLMDAFQIRKAPDPNNPFATQVYMLPEDIIDNTIKAFSVGPSGYSQGAPTGRYIAPANSPACMETVNGFGDCGVRSLIVTGPKVVRFDFNFVKRIPITEKVTLEGQAEVFNVFNNVNFTPVNYAGATPSSYQVTGAIDQSRTMQLNFRISF